MADVKYKTLNDLNEAIRLNLWKIPHDVDVVVGIPRSGMIAASIISELISKPLSDDDSFVNGKNFSGGNRSYFLPQTKYNRVLVVDDTCAQGVALARTKEKFKNIGGGVVEFIYLSIYVETEKAKTLVDLYLEEFIHNNDYHFFEWNVYDYHPSICKYMLFDCDGVLCKDPPNDINKEEYEEYLPNAIPLHIPSNMIGGVVTGRLRIYQNITLEWFKKNSVKTQYLIMVPFDSREERNEKMNPGIYKGNVYKAFDWAILFIESNDYEAQIINKVSGKPVLCSETNRLYKTNE